MSYPIRAGNLFSVLSDSGMIFEKRNRPRTNGDGFFVIYPTVPAYHHRPCVVLGRRRMSKRKLARHHDALTMRATVRVAYFHGVHARRPVVSHHFDAALEISARHFASVAIVANVGAHSVAVGAQKEQIVGGVRGEFQFERRAEGIGFAPGGVGPVAVE